MIEITIGLILILAIFSGLGLIRYKLHKSVGNTGSGISKKIGITLIFLLIATPLIKIALSLDWKVILDRIFVGLIVIRETLKRPITIGGLLFGIYSLVRFIKRSRNKE